MAELVVALDLPSAKEALALADRLPDLSWAKVGPVLFVRDGPAVVRELERRGVAVFLDLKWHDIPSSVAGAVAAARELGVTMATVHCLGGSAMLHAAADEAGDLALVGVTVLTSQDGDVGPEVERLARLAHEAGLAGVVASGREAAGLRRLLGPKARIVVPGIRAPGDAAQDQARTVTPEEAVQRGATHLVVGRPITGARDPAAAFRAFRDAAGVSSKP